MKTLIVALTFLSVWCGPHGQAARDQMSAGMNHFDKLKRDYYAHLKPEHGAVLKAWLLKHKPWLRPAVEDPDSVYHKNPEKIRRVIGKDAHQFYAFGDFNDNGKEDFAVILVDDRDDYTEDCERDICSAFAVFNGDFSDNQAPSFYEEELDMIEYGYLAFDQKVKHRLYFGSLEGYYFCAALIPKGEGYEKYEGDSNCGYREPRAKQ
jgi:hypothetical protein